MLEGELILTYTWNNNGHNICGHIFELIDYYYILKDVFDTRVLFIGLSEEDFRTVIKKYTFTQQEVEKLLSVTTFNNYHPTLIKCKNIFFMDGDINTMNLVTYLSDNVFTFACGNKEIKNNVNPKLHVLQDQRVYEQVKVNGIDYKKKILFSKLKSPIRTDKILMYLTGNCRILELDVVKDYILSNPGNYLLLTDNDYYDSLSNICQIERTPYEEFINISKYIYTPISRKWDCSPRMIAECQYFGIDVEYLNIDYLDTDLGLKYRIEDLKNLNQVELTKDDNIINILKEIIWKKLK